MRHSLYILILLVFAFHALEAAPKKASKGKWKPSRKIAKATPTPVPTPPPTPMVPFSPPQASTGDVPPETKQTIETTSSVMISVPDPSGTPVKEMALQKDANGFYDLLFRGTVSEPYQNYVSWALEISEPKENCYYQMALEGKLPEIIHWDGIFSDESEVQLGKTYFVRLLVVNSDGKIAASPWGTFDTISKRPYEGPKNRGEYISLYVMPQGGAYYLSVKTPSVSSITYPAVYGDFRLHFQDQYMCGMGFWTTANAVLGYQVEASANGFGFSDVSGFCRYRFAGAPLRAPVLPLSPTYLGKDFKPVIPEDAWGKPTNFEVGLKLFHTTLRGFTGTTLDRELFQAATGLAATINFNQAFWMFRAHLALEGGYSVFRGSTMMGTGEFAITFERLRDVSPGIQLRYSLFQGTAGADQPNAGAELTNNLLFVGLMGYFKL